MIHTVLIRSLYVAVLIACILATAGISVLLESKQFVFKQVTEKPTAEIVATPFPVSVDPVAQTITTQDLLENHPSESLALIPKQPDTWQEKVVAFFSRKEWYQNLASPVSRILVIWPGERKEEIVAHIGDTLRWDNKQRNTFTELMTQTEPAIEDGTFYPGEYVAHRGATPEEIATLIQAKFSEDIANRYTPEVASKVPLKDALIIASLLEREARDFENMREISGVIWNRLFIDMPLQLDATLQYAKGSKATEKNWWPVPKPADKYIKSPFNTYANKGLPPSPIANPSAASVLAALNPRPTECLYYFHDNRRNYHCSITYEEHVQKLKATFGRGR